MILSAEDIATAPSHISAHVLQRLDEHGGLDGHMQGPADSRSSKEVGTKLLAACHESGHLMLGKLDLLAAEVGEGDVCDSEVSGAHGARRGGGLDSAVSVAGGRPWARCGLRCGLLLDCSDSAELRTTGQRS